MTLFWILLGLLGLTAVLICYSACVVSSRENYVPRNYYEAVIQELCRKHTEEIASMPTIVRCKECKYNYSTERNHGKMHPRCDFTDWKLKENDFCSRGERRADE